MKCIRNWACRIDGLCLIDLRWQIQKLAYWSHWIMAESWVHTRSGAKPKLRSLSANKLYSKTPLDSELKFASTRDPSAESEIGIQSSIIRLLVSYEKNHNKQSVNDRLRRLETHLITRRIIVKTSCIANFRHSSNTDDSLDGQVCLVKLRKTWSNHRIH